MIIDPNVLSQSCTSSCSRPAEQLNRDCFCSTLNRDQLDSILRADILNEDVLATHPQLFSNTSVFISPLQLQQMQDLISVVTQVTDLPLYAEQVLARAPDVARRVQGTAGVFMGYDFHLSAQGPKVIEINTNAGGAFLNAALVKAQSECCSASGMLVEAIQTNLDDEFMAMFLHEWKLARGDVALRCVAIVDENPQQQFLYPEFKMAQRLFERNNIKAVIVDPSELTFENNQLFFQEDAIDLVYNRLTDFSFSQQKNALLRSAYLQDTVVVTPNPNHYALLANKQNLELFCDSDFLKAIGASEKQIKLLQLGIPLTQTITPENAERLWAERRQLFFKPASGFGSRATYRGDKITKRVWEEILQHKYVAQHIVVPSERGVWVDEREAALKMDIRAYVYSGQIQLLAARLYQGQTTNFRTQGGGFAPVFIAS